MIHWQATHSKPLASVTRIMSYSIACAMVLLHRPI
jgi:hypothetical protein